MPESQGKNNSEGPRRRIITLVIIMSSFTSSFMGSAMNIAVPGISAGFSVSAAMTGWIITVYALVTCALSVPFGKLADRAGKNKVFLAGQGLMVLGCLLAIPAPNFYFLVAARGVQAVGASMIFATNTAIIASAYPPHERGKAIGRMLTGTYVGLASGPVLSGLVNDVAGWRGIMAAGFALGMVSLIPSLKALPLREEVPQALKTDRAGNVLFILMIGSFMFGFANVGKGVWPLLLMGAGVLIGILFVRSELSAEDPVVDVRLFRGEPVFVLSNLAALFNYSANFGISYFMSIFLQTDLGYPSRQAGLILLITPLVMSLFTAKAGALSDVIAPYKLASAGMGICGVCLAFFASVHHDTPLVLIIITLAVAGFGMSMFSSPNTNAIMSCVDKSHFGVASSILATMRTLGQTTGICIITIVVGLLLGDQTLSQAPAADFEYAMRICFAIFSAICFLGMLMSLKRRNA